MPILPVLGNNDGLYHNYAVDAADATQFYSDLWQIWFEEVPGNAPFKNDATISSDFHAGGYYAINIIDDLTIFGLNGLYPFHKNALNKATGSTDMLNWFSTKLAANGSRRFLTTSHVFAGNNYYEGLEQFWETEYTNAYFTTLN